ncbi:alpha/beta-hydrolase [Lophiostoma macrostomum CBS 122681]|uniref:Alpha/beta-hydrolase n=1 Tax=Lophiostoma macrostomum CBS 122681 TaxID=1314788 RepID=A0A6A6T7S7_9PLEO|nr:alpha/beta-hydrolase [Lophiostoma macrostomum CBS 122681]
MFSRHTFVSALLASLSTAAPLDISRRAISADVLDQLQFFSQYSAAAYCGGNNNSTGTKITCPQGNCARVEAADTNTLTEFENTLATDATGFVATDSTNSLIVVSFRGSRSVRNWLTDVEFPTVPTTICAGCDASDGFWSSWLEAQDQVVAAVSEAQKAFPSYRVVVTGHSLGGALASLGAGALRNSGVAADLYTYGSPKVGNAALATYLSGTSTGSNYRVTHKNDPVPRLPPLALGFRHVQPEYYVSSDDTTQPTTNDITVYTEAQEAQGNEGNLGIDIDAHLWYFGEISACDGSQQIEIKM